jgi:tripartite-type tricarboxylate transporter receptor subunit TctC
MKLPRRKFLHLAAGAAALPAASRIARAQAYPTRPVRFVHGFAAGGSGDIAARLIAQWLSDRLGQQFVVENRTGAGGNIAVEAVTRAPADGYTLLQLNVANTINTALYERLSFNLLNDIAPVASFMRVPNVMEVTPSLPVKTVPEFIAYAKANPGKISFASSGVGSSIHMSGELFKAMAKIDMLHVPYRGIAAGGLSDLMTGVVHVAFDNLPSSIELIRSGKVRALAVTTTVRSELLPDVPTVDDFLPGYEASAWYGVGAPRTRRSRSWNGSTRSSTPRLPIRGRRHGLLSSVARRFPARLPTSTGSSLKKSRSGARWSSSLALKLRQNDRRVVVL